MGPTWALDDVEDLWDKKWVECEVM